MGYLYSTLGITVFRSFRKIDGIFIERIVAKLLTFDFGNADRILSHHLVSSGHVPFTNVTRSGAVMASEFEWPVTSSAVETSKTFVMSILAWGIVSGCLSKIREEKRDEK